MLFGGELKVNARYELQIRAISLFHHTAKEGLHCRAIGLGGLNTDVNILQLERHEREHCSRRSKKERHIRNAKVGS